jgi:phosphoribosylglycinamide formyltransferase-1
MRLGILGSTRGTHFLSIAQAIDDGRLDAEIVVVLSNKADSGILDKARDRAIEAIHVPVNGQARADYDRQLNHYLEKARVDLVVLVGYMRLLSAEFVQQWKQRIINIHPSLLPAHAGLMDQEVHAAVLANHEQISGCTVHWVTEELDAGPIIVQRQCPVYSEDTVVSLRARVQSLEAEALITAIQFST